MSNRSNRGMNLHFPWSGVTKALAELRAATEVRTLYADVTGPGLWLVGDQGVYLMPNTAARTTTIVYARECDPTRLDFDTWWANKRASFGGDDGVDFIPLADIDSIAADIVNTKTKCRYLQITITPNKFTISTS
jgi:Protein of unknown function (DUF3085)